MCVSLGLVIYPLCKRWNYLNLTLKIQMPTSTILSNMWARGKKEIKVSSGQGKTAFCNQKDQKVEGKKKPITKEYFLKEKAAISKPS